ncbi:MAG: 2-amino-4-hydroxy-6-hydroxymethyldihydropteridine diphosphokinase [Ottowia sp.]|nr:2-amino-4-hydroxy-6-hydroxymethyldihydropteridine diphosphokinase [Ottowia sp.]
MTLSRPPITAFVALGANLGDAPATLRAAIAALDELPHTHMLRHSRLWRSAPVDASGPDYINAAAAVETRLTAPALLHELLALEARFGRQRPYHHAPRTLDLDLLLYGGARIASPQLSVPHPRMWQRAFVLRPLVEIASQLVTADMLAAVASQQIAPLAA